MEVPSRMDLESIILNQRETNTVWPHSYAEPTAKRKKKSEKRSSLWLLEAESWGEEELDEGGQKIQTISYKISPRNAMYSRIAVVNRASLVAQTEKKG